MMRATLITSAIGGVIFGIAITLIGRWELDSKWAMLVFLPVMIFAVIGLRQIRDNIAEMDKRGSLWIARAEDFRTHYFPAWGRMFIWFISSAVSAFALQALGF